MFEAFFGGCRGATDRTNQNAIFAQNNEQPPFMPILPKIFIAYAREDKPLLQKLRTHLNVMKRQQHCEIFYDGEIMPGEAWDKRLKEELHTAHIFVLLVTAEFLDSDYVNETELPEILERRANGEVEVVAVILKDCLWDLTELQKLQVVLYEGNPIEKNDAYAHAAREVLKIIGVHNEKFCLNLERELEAIQLERETLKRKIEIDKLRLETIRKNKVLTHHQEHETELQRHRSFDPFHDLMLPIQGGTFKMGDEYGDLKANCRPLHDVAIKDFQLCKYPVTQAQWRAVMGDQRGDGGPSWFKGDELPLESVSWIDVQLFINILKEKTGRNYRIPSEAEWEFAARGGTISKKFKYSGSNKLDEIAWHSGNSGNKPQPVMAKKPNELGLYDMTGNIWEWCQDNWHDNYQNAPKDGGAWIFDGDQSRRVVRGGSWHDDSNYCRIGSRSRFVAVENDIGIGFRLAM